MMKRLLLLVAAAALALAAVPAFAQPVQQYETTLSFELTVEGQPPANATFWGQYLVEGATVRLTDPDGDGVYTGSMSGGTPAEGAGFQIVQGTGIRDSVTGAYPGEPVTVIEDFGAPAVEGDRTFSASVSFNEDDGSSGKATGEPVVATGVIEKPDMTTYQYGTHAVTDEATGTRYALASEEADLDAFVGERATIYGASVPAYENGAIEGGPPLVEVERVEPESGAPGGTTAAEEVTVAFRLAVEGEVPEDYSFYVESSSGPGGVICTTDAAVVEQAGYPECREGNNELRLSMPAGEPFDYRILKSRGVELSRGVVAEGSEVAEEGLVVEASYSAANDPLNGADVNGDGAVDEADGELAASITTSAASVTPPGEPALPDTGGMSPLPLLAVLAGLLARHAVP